MGSQSKAERFIGEYGTDKIKQRMWLSQEKKINSGMKQIAENKFEQMRYWKILACKKLECIPENIVWTESR